MAERNTIRTVGEIASIEGVKVAVRLSKDGKWLSVVIHAPEAITGYAVSVNGRDLPYNPGGS